MDDEKQSSATIPAKDEEKSSWKSKNESSAETNPTVPCGNHDNDNSSAQIARSGETISGVDIVSGALKSVDIGSSAPDCKGELSFFLVASL